MKMRKLGIVFFQLFVTLAIQFSFTDARCLADDPKPPAEKAKAVEKEESKSLPLIEQSLKRYKVYAGDSKKPMKPITVLTWTNPIAGSLEKCQTVLFLHEGQAKAASCIWMSSSLRLYHEFGAITRENLRGTLDGKTQWQFVAGSQKYKPIPDADVPAADRRRRLLQMKQLVRRFKAIETQSREGLPARIELRMLAKPLYRYEKESSKVEDGAVFCFAHTTDPEALVIIEAVRNGDKLQWEYAFLRRTTLPVIGELDGKVVWSTDEVGYDAFNQIRYTQ